MVVLPAPEGAEKIMSFPCWFIVDSSWFIAHGSW